MVESKLIVDVLNACGFKKIEGKKLYIKKFDNYQIDADLDNNEINYGSKIRYDRKTTTNFNDKENLVVLECVVRLIEKGYDPANLYLEKNCGDHKDFIDILILDEKTKAFAIVECKTFGKEFVKAECEAKSKGKQIFRYAVQDNNTKYVILYTSRIVNSKIEYEYRIIDLNQYKYSNREELFDVWDKTFEKNGFFESNIRPYMTQFLGITQNSLKEFDDYDIERKDNEGSLFHQIEEILRRHTVSDKNNAYNKIFNLFLCKIVDEDSKTETELMDFQWRKTESNETVMLRLNDLYKKGVRDYLNVLVTDYSENEIDQALVSNIKPEVMKIINELRLYKSNEFAFIDVFNKDTFDKNCEVVKEIVKLIEGKRIKNFSKKQLLGDMFEKLLNIGIKQEQGQFFTPTPITEFILKSLPIREIIQEKIRNKENYFLPYIIDYACGSGHFLTEAIREIDCKIKEITNQNLSNMQRSNLESWKLNYNWANEFVYGIEKDYRLAKTTKIACFMHGDGLANIIWEDGLASFNDSNYIGKLKTLNNRSGNEFIDILVSNPPYSVDGFRESTANVEGFNLSKYVTNDSKEIECLFIERMYQLLKVDGVVGIVLPTAILTRQTEIYSAARKLIIDKFDIISIISLGSEAFMKTEIKTSIFFLRKKRDGFEGNNTILLCNLDHQTDKKLERKLLGYEFSERRGKEGIHKYDGGVFINNQEIDLSRLIYDSFIDDTKIKGFFDEDGHMIKDCLLKDYVCLASRKDLITNDEFREISFLKYFYKVPTFKVQSKPLGALLNQSPISGKRPTGGTNRIENGVISLGGGNIGVNGEINLAKIDYITEDYYNTKIKTSAKVCLGDILLCKDGARTGKVCYISDLNDSDMVVNEHVFILRVNNQIQSKYLFYYLYSTFGQAALEPLKTKGGQGGINGTKLQMCLIPIIKDQEEFVEKADQVMKEVKESERQMHISKLIESYII